MTAKPKVLKCAIYTRKSSEEGLDQAYNSLDAQRDACTAYVTSQIGEGWVLLPDAYDDGGFSGGNLDRPALRRLLADIETGRVDVVVVYKVDRLTRSLHDFAKIVEVLDRCDASFVSVTQAFNTTTSMGRLTLNVLLSFAQFEREVTGERIRDKIAASKKLGMWMGGNVPLGYRPKGRTLEIEPTEAAMVRLFFARYLELGSVYKLRQELAEQNVVSRAWTTANGKPRGGRPLQHGALFHLLRNRTYIGEIPHKDTSYPGQHPAIVAAEQFEAVQSKLDETATVLKPNRPPLKHRPQTGAALKSLIYDAAGARLSPVSARRRSGVTYRYYVSRILQAGGGHESSRATVRIPAAILEEPVLDRLRRLGLLAASDNQVDWSDITRWVEKVVVGPGVTTMTLTIAAIGRMGSTDWMVQRLPVGDRVLADDDHARIVFPLEFARRGGATVAVNPRGGAVDRPQLDPALSSALIRAEAWKRQLLAGEVATIDELARAEDINPTYAARVMRVAFLAPDLKRAILEGREPRGLTLQAMITRDVPLAWQDQRDQYCR